MLVTTVNKVDKLHTWYIEDQAIDILEDQPIEPTKDMLMMSVSPKDYPDTSEKVAYSIYT